MRSIRDAACLLVAVGSIALSAWQPAVAEADAAVPSCIAKPVDHRVPQTGGPTVPSAPVRKA